jgi:hypothetical protein
MATNAEPAHHALHEQGQQTAELRLHPEDLGQVQISLKLDDNQAQLQMVSHSHVARHWKLHCQRCVHRLLKTAFSFRRAASAVRASRAATVVIPAATGFAFWSEWRF